SGTGNDVGDVGTQVGINDIGTANADQGIELVGRDIASLENTGLLALDQERNLVLDLRCHGNRDDGFKNTVGQLFRADFDTYLDVRAFLFQENCRRIGLFKRQVFQVDALDLKDG